MTNRPLWLLDVDGVINAVTRKPDRSIWPDWRQGTVASNDQRLGIWFSPTVIATIADMHATGQVEARWLTTWGSEANDDLRELLGLPFLTVAAEPPRSVQGTHPSADAPSSMEVSWWKLAAAKDVSAAEPTRPMIWTDDDLRFHRSAQAWGAECHDRRLLVAPPTAVGLTPRNLRTVRAFAGRFSPA